MTRTVLALFLISLVVACSDSPSTATQTSPPDRVQIEATLASAPPTAQAAAASPDLEPALPRADLFDLARRYRGLDLPSQVITQPPVASAGAVRSFFVVDLEANRAQEVRATLLAQTEHADIWVQDGQRFGRADAQRSGEIFETEVYPQVTRAFGLPAVAPDGSAGRIAILHTSLRGAGGYFAGSDQFPRTLVPFSNEQQILYLDSSIARPGDRAYAGLLAHEFQHLVHQQHNPNADTWINEGLSEVADEMLGGSNSFLRRFETLPDTQLDDWPAEGNSAAHYGAAHSFLRYLLRRYGGLEGAQRLAAEGANGVNSVERYLRRDYATGFLDVFTDWMIANLLDEGDDGPYSQPGISHRIRTIDRLPAGGQEDGTVSQLGARYLELRPEGHDVTVRFDGGESVAPLDVSPASGTALWWSNRGDSLDTTLTREIDLRAVRSATLRFKLWFNVERDYDFGYIAASRDGGRSWQALTGRHTTARDPLQTAYGPGYSGRSGGDAPGWLDEEVDLSAFAGERILLRFEYVTDEASHMDGFAIDDLSVPEIGWRDDAESDGDWQAAGFTRVQRPLPQRFIIQVVEVGPSDATTVRRILLDARNDATITIPRTTSKATIVLSGTTLGTTTPARYSIEIRR